MASSTGAGTDDLRVLGLAGAYEVGGLCSAPDQLLKAGVPTGLGAGAALFKSNKAQHCAAKQNHALIERSRRQSGHGHEYEPSARLAATGAPNMHRGLSP
jgi:hypothetical protein